MSSISRIVISNIDSKIIYFYFVFSNRYLLLEHEFKSLDFTRTKLVNKNTRLEERMSYLENELENLRVYQENQPPVPGWSSF